MSEINNICFAKVDLAKPLKPETLTGVYALFDSGPELVTEVYRDGAAADLTGCEAYAYFTDAAGNVANSKCKIDGNTITTTIGAAFLHAPGRFTVSIQIRKLNKSQTVRIVRGYLYGTVPADYWQDITYTSVMQTGADEVTIQFRPNTAFFMVRWELFEIVGGEYVLKGIAMPAVVDGQYLWEAVVYGVEAGSHEYCLRGTYNGVVSDYTKSATVYVDADWTA